MKKFLIRSLIIFFVAALITIGVFYFVSKQTATQNVMLETIKESTSTAVSKTEEKAAEATSAIVEKIPEGGVPLSSIPLTDSQKKALSAVNIDVETFVITEAMIACAGGKIGDERMTEITEGSAPSILEMAKLTPCLTAQ